MNIRLDDLLVVGSLAVSAWALHSFGFRVRSAAVAVALVGLPLLVWAAGPLWLYALVRDLGLPQVLAALPAVGTYVLVVLIVTRQIGGLTYRLPDRGGSFAGELIRSDQALHRAFQAKPVMDAEGWILAEPTRKRLERALNEFRGLRAPPGEWTRLFEERIALHEAYVEIMMSPSPVGPDIVDPLERRSRQWKLDVKRQIALDEESL